MTLPRLSRTGAVLCLLQGTAGFAPPSHAAVQRTVAAVAARAPAPSAAEGELPASAALLKPMQDYILVDLQVVPEASSGGILLPTVYYDFDEKNEEAFVAPKPRAGTVVAVGPGARSFDGNKTVSYTHLTLPTICSV